MYKYSVLQWCPIYCLLFHARIINAWWCDRTPPTLTTSGWYWPSFTQLWYIYWIGDVLLTWHSTLCGGVTYRGDHCYIANIKWTVCLLYGKCKCMLISVGLNKTFSLYLYTMGKINDVKNSCNSYFMHFVWQRALIKNVTRTWWLGMGIIY